MVEFGFQFGGFHWVVERGLGGGLFLLSFFPLGQVLGWAYGVAHLHAAGVSAFYRLELLWHGKQNKRNVYPVSRQGLAIHYIRFLGFMCDL